MEEEEDGGRLDGEGELPLLGLFRAGESNCELVGVALMVSGAPHAGQNRVPCGTSRWQAEQFIARSDGA